MSIFDDPNKKPPLLRVENLTTVFEAGNRKVTAVDDVSFEINAGETFALVGESGSGKSITALSTIRLLPEAARVTTGSIHFGKQDLLSLPEREMRDIRGSGISMIFQEPMTSLNPVVKVGKQISEVLIRHQGMSKAQARQRALDLLDAVNIKNPSHTIDTYAHELSGGMKQRVMIAIALACEPKLLIADEPTTALDVTIQAQILDLVRELRKDSGMGIVWITHDLAVIAGIADRVLVMYGGQIVESAAVTTLFERPAHPYTQALLQTLPDIENNDTDAADNATAFASERRLKSIEGQPPDLRQAPTSCAFAPRCEFVLERCLAENPRLQIIDTDHSVACWLAQQPVGRRHGG